MFYFFVISPPLPQANVDVPSVPPFEELFRNEAPYVLRLLARFGIAEREREDVAQEVFVRVHAKLSSYDPARPLRPWLYAFAYRCASNHRRLARNIAERPTSDLDAQTELSARAPEEQLFQKERHRHLMDLLECLDWKDRSVLVLHDLEELSVKDIADSLDAPATTIYSRLHSARKKLIALAQADIHEEANHAR